MVEFYNCWIAKNKTNEVISNNRHNSEGNGNWWLHLEQWKAYQIFEAIAQTLVKSFICRLATI